MAKLDHFATKLKFDATPHMQRQILPSLSYSTRKHTITLSKNANNLFPVFTATALKPPVLMGDNSLSLFTLMTDHLDKPVFWGPGSLRDNPAVMIDGASYANRLHVNNQRGRRSRLVLLPSQWRAC